MVMRSAVLLDRKRRPLYHIVGCNHGIQPGIGFLSALDGKEVNEQREHFTKLVRELCAEHELQIVLEEDGTVEETAGHQLAVERNIPWENINTTNEDKERMDIPRDYVDGPYDEERKREWSRQRETFMAGKIIAHQKASPRGLVICGFDHSEALMDLLKMRGIPTQVWDYRKLDWYRSGVFAECP